MNTSALPKDEAEKRLWREQRASVRDSLMEHWDPIGVGGIPEAADEYDNYVGDVVAAFRSGKSADEVEAHLRWIASEHMGLGPNHHPRDYKELMQRLLALRIGA